MYLEIEVTAQPREKPGKLAFDYPYYSHFWDFQDIKKCWCCGQTETRTGSICQYCLNKFPIKKSKND